MKTIKAIKDKQREKYDSFWYYLSTEWKYLLFYVCRVLVHIVAKCHEENLDANLHSYIKV